jgi:urate oxidase
VIDLGPNRYGKESIRVVRVDRDREPHRVRDLTVGVQLEGAFEAVHVEGDNAACVATDTMKNTVYAFAADRLDGSIEAYGRALAGHFARVGTVARATITIAEHPWASIAVDGSTSRDAFVRSGLFTRTARVQAGRGLAAAVEAGLDDLTVMKTTRSSFSGFQRDRYTTLPETDDRMMASRIGATWRYESAVLAPGARGAAGADPGPDSDDFDAEFRAIRATMTEVLADHDSPSVQASIWIVGRAVLERHPAVAEITIRMPNLHHWLADLSPFGLENPNQVYVATSEPYGLIEATVRRSA